MAEISVSKSFGHIFASARLFGCSRSAQPRLPLFEFWMEKKIGRTVSEIPMARN